ncbi:EF-hand domain-containing protein [Novosphingobium profundi]|uniref:EF-hand domain-containing protein n=1 Tax=Novosphingobium profundi TaxID=1774954 RepID=UPI001BDAE8B9|nr:EF-hand domain-containing protein [Novosphingobium profundi]MBT0670926.1 EF-hand domain-containing protein [Novosphingobium profundi]
MKALPLLLTLGALAASSTGVRAQTAPTPEQQEQARAMFAKMDTDGDGALSLAEWTASGHRERGFAFVDTDKDGKVTPAELRAAAAKRR